jgi:hypothetical protein
MNMPVDAHRGAALVGRERVGQDRRGVGHQHRPAERLDHPETDQPESARGAGQRVERQEQSTQGEDREAGVVHLDPAVDVAQPAEGDDQDGRHDQVAHQHPQQVADVARGQRVELDAAEPAPPA